MESSKEQFRISTMKSGNQILVVGGCYISRYFWSSFVDILLVGVFVHLLREVCFGDNSMLIWFLGGSFLCPICDKNGTYMIEFCAASIYRLYTDFSKEAYAENLAKIASKLSVLEPI